MKRSYEQLCPLAGALDAVGDRWTLLLVRELLLGPRRYGQLAAALPGAGTNLLAERLRRLTQEGIVERRDGGYALTSRGRDLKPAVLALARWGLPTLTEPGAADRAFRPAWLMLSLQAMFRPERAGGVSETWEYRVGDDTFWVHVEDGEIDAGLGPGSAPDLVITADPEAFRAIGAQRLDPAQALAEGRLAVTGEPKRFLRSLEILPPPGARM